MIFWWMPLKSLRRPSFRAFQILRGVTGHLAVAHALPATARTAGLLVLVWFGISGLTLRAETGLRTVHDIPTVPVILRDRLIRSRVVRFIGETLLFFEQ